MVSRPEDEHLTLSQLLLAGMFSGLTTTLLSVPGERIKCLLQMQVSPKIQIFNFPYLNFPAQIQIQTTGPKYKGFTDALIKLYEKGGIRNLYVGTCATLLRDVTASGIYFGLYDLIMRITTEKTNQVKLH